MEQQIERLKRPAPSDGQFDWLPANEYGIRAGDEDYVIPIARSTLLSIMEGPVFRLMRLDKPMDYRLEQNAFVYIGGSDPFQTTASDTMFRHLEERIPATERCFVQHGGHSLEGCEELVIEAIVKWVLKDKAGSAG